MTLLLTPLQAFQGIAWGIAAFTFKNVGYVLQKAGVKKTGLEKYKERPKLEDGTEEEKGNLLKTPLWWVGLILTNFGAFALIIAYGTQAPVTLIMPFMGLGLVISVIFCKYYLKEDVSRNEWIASGIIILGIVLVSLVYKELPESEDNLEFYFIQYAKIPSLIFFLLAFGGIAIAIIWTKKNDWKYASIIFGIAAGDVGGTTLIFQTPFSKGLNNIGALAGMDVVYFAFGLILFAIGGVFAVIFLNVGYLHGEGILVAPIYATTQMLFPIIGGIIVYGEWAIADTLTIGLQLSGIIIISLGVFILSYFNEKKRKLKEAESVAIIE